MSAKIRYHMPAFTEIATSSEMLTLISEHAEQVKAQANSLAQTRGAKYEIGKAGVFGKKAPRVRVSVHAANRKGLLDNHRNNTLLRALGGGT